MTTQTGKVINISQGKVILTVNPKIKVLQVVYCGKTETDLNPTELETLDLYITQYELLEGYVLIAPIEYRERI